MAFARSGRAVRAILSVAVLASLLATAMPAAVVAQDEEAPSFAKMDQPFGKLGLTPVADTTAIVDGAAFPFTGSVDGSDGADITLSAVSAVKLSKQQAKQAANAWQKVGAGAIKAGRYLAAVFETADPPTGDVAFYLLLDGPKANDAVPGFPLDPRSGYQLAPLVGVLGGAMAAGDTQVAGQALADGLQFYDLATETAVWRKGNRWYVLRALPKGATVVDLRSQLTVGNQQAYDFASAGPTTLAGAPIPGLRCFNEIGTPMASFEDGSAPSNILQLNLEVDPAAGAELDPAGLQLVETSGSGKPIVPEVIAFDELGSTLVSFVGVPNGRHRLEATSAGAELIARLLPSVLHFDGTALGGLSQSISCSSTVDGLYAAGVEACSFGDPAVIGEVFGVEPVSITPVAAADPDGSQLCGWGNPNVLAGTSFGVRLADDLDLVKGSLSACEQTGLPGEYPSFIAVCPGLIQHVQPTPANVPGAPDSVGFPSGTAFLLGQDPAVDAYLGDFVAALDTGDVGTAAGLLAPLLGSDALGYERFAAAQEGFLGQ